MPDSPRSCNASSGCRIDWRPSRVEAGALVVLALLAAAAVMASAVPGPLDVPLAGGALLRGLWLARGAAARPPCVFEWPGAGAPPRMWMPDRVTTLRDVRLEWRGPLVRLQARDRRGRPVGAVWWPDTLPSHARRQLRLVSRSGGRSDNPLPSMAA
jgi:toxin CptA